MAELVFDIRLGAGGNASTSLVSGWYCPEEGFNWTCGCESTLRFGTVNPQFDYLLVFSGWPFIRAPNLLSQVLIVRLGAIQLGCFQVSGSFSEWAIVPSHLIKHNELAVTFEFPNCHSPAEFGLQDTRKLAIAFTSFQLVGLQKTSTAPTYHERDFNWPKRQSCRKTRLNPQRTPRLRRLVERATLLAERGDYLELQTLLLLEAGKVSIRVEVDDYFLGELVVLCMIAALPSTIFGVFERVYGSPAVTILFSSDASRDPSVVRCVFTGDYGCQIILRNDLLEVWHTDRQSLSNIVANLMITLPLIYCYAASGRPKGSLNINLGDEAHVRGLAFCGTTPDTTLIPDPIFLKTDGYREQRDKFASVLVPWTERRNVVLWRGSSTGYRKSADILGLDRVRLCLYANRPENLTIMDVGLTDLVQVNAHERDQLERLNIMREVIAPERFQEWKYQLDIDGNSNAWSGLFLKLLSGSVVLKVASSGGWRQWYYGRLKPFENYVPIDQDFSDLVPKLKYLIYNDDVARRIGEAGRQLALSMTFEQEVELAMESIERAVAFEFLPLV